MIFLTISNANAQSLHEDLFQRSAELTMVDVYFGNNYLITVLASFTPERLKFANPELIVNKIPTIKEPDKVIKALSGLIITHSSRLCDVDLKKSCQYLSPKTATVIFDISNFRVDLLINPKLLINDQAEIVNYLPKPKAKKTGIFSFDTRYSKYQDNKPNYSVFSDATLFHNNLSLNFVNLYKEDTTYTENITLGIDHYPKTRTRIGILPSGSNSFLAGKNILGFSYGSVLDNLDTKNLSKLYGTPINLFLTNNSLIEIYRADNNRLLFSRNYLAGNQSIDSSELPFGSYEIIVKIVDPILGERIEKMFFVKSAVIPPVDHPIYRIEAGKIQKATNDKQMPEFIDNTRINLAYDARLTEKFGAGVDLTNAYDDSFLGIKIINISEYTENLLGYTKSNYGAYGLEASNILRLKKFSSYLAYRTWKDYEDANDYGLRPLSQEKANINLNYNFHKANLGTRYSITKKDNKTDKSIGLFGSVPIHKRAGLNANLYFEISNNDGVDFAQISLVFNFYRGNFYASSNIKRNSNNENSIQNNVNHKHKFADGGKLDSKLSLAKYDDRNEVAIEESLLTRFSEADIYSKEIDFYNSDNKHNYGGSLKFGFAINSGAVNAGIINNSKNGVVNIKVEDIPGSNKVYEVQISGREKMLIKANTEYTIGLTPYKYYTIKLDFKSKTDFIELENSDLRKIAIFPGDIQNIHWKVRNKLILIGKIVNKSNEAIKNAQLVNSLDNASTDDKGNFQAEIYSDLKILKIKALDNSLCEINLAKFVINKNNTVVINKLLCDF